MLAQTQGQPVSLATLREWFRPLTTEPHWIR
nr:hypothetical protein [Citrobacter amalonaticus]